MFNDGVPYIVPLLNLNTGLLMISNECSIIPSMNKEKTFMHNNILVDAKLNVSLASI